MSRPLLRRKTTKGEKARGIKLMENDQTKSFHDNCFLIIKISKALSQPHDCLAVG